MQLEMIIVPIDNISVVFGLNNIAQSIQSERWYKYIIEVVVFLCLLYCVCVCVFVCFNMHWGTV